MYPDSRQIIHMGINFRISPLPTIDVHSNLGFQQALVHHGIDFSRVAFKEQEIVVARDTPTRLEVKIATVAPPSVGQLLILAPHPGRDLMLFTKEVEAIVGAFQATWPAQDRQIISRDATLRELYETSAEHAFRELWEVRLQQPLDSLAVLGRPVSGGGLRLVMPPQPDDPEPVQIEVKIESFLRDAKKIFVETQFTWPSPMRPGQPFDPADRLAQVDRYIEESVVPFITGGPRVRA